MSNSKKTLKRELIKLLGNAFAFSVQDKATNQLHVQVTLENRKEATQACMLYNEYYREKHGRNAPIETWEDENPDGFLGGFVTTNSDATKEFIEEFGEVIAWPAMSIAPPSEESPPAPKTSASDWADFMRGKLARERANSRYGIPPSRN